MCDFCKFLYVWKIKFWSCNIFGPVRICSVQAGCPFSLNRFLNGPFQLLGQAVTSYFSAPVNHVGDFGRLSSEFPYWLLFLLFTFPLWLSTKIQPLPGEWCLLVLPIHILSYVLFLLPAWYLNFCVMPFLKSIFWTNFILAGKLPK